MIRERGETMTSKEAKEIHKCDACAKEDIWTDSWVRYGSLKDLDEGQIEKSCSPECMAELMKLRHARKNIIRKKHA